MTGRPVTVLVALVALLVVGAVAASRMPLQLLPQGLVNRELSIWVPFPGANPKEVEAQVARPLEESLRTVPRAKGVETRSTNDFCRATVSFQPDADMDPAYLDVRDRLDRAAAAFPDGVGRVRVHRFDSERDIPIVFLAVLDDGSGDLDDKLEHLVIPRLERLDGVARAQGHGLLARRLAIDLDAARVAAHRVNLGDLVRRLRADNANAPAGTVEEGGRRLFLRTIGRFATVDEVRGYRIRDDLVIGDVAEVHERRALRDFVVRVDRRFAKVLAVYKESAANVVDTCRRVRSAVEGEMKEDPRLAGLDYRVFFDQGELIEASLASMRGTALWGGAFATLVLLVFLRRLGPTLVVAFAIPLSMVVALVCLYFQGGSLNVIAMAGLTLATGMVVDNAIVVIESITRRREEGAAPVEAARSGTRAVAMAVTLSTLTTVLVFLPLVFMASDSNVRVMTGELAWPVTYALAGSLAVALVVIPLASVTLIRSGPAPAGRAAASLAGAFDGLLAWCLRCRFEACLVLAALLASTAIPWHWMKQTHQFEPGTSEVSLHFEMPRHFSLREANGVMEGYEAWVHEHREELGLEDFLVFFDRTTATLRLFFDPARRVVGEVVAERLRSDLPVTPGVQWRLAMERGSGQNEVDLTLTGPSSEELSEVAPLIEERLRREPGLVGARSDLGVREDEVQVRFARDLAHAYGVNPQMASQVVAWSLRGALLREFAAPDREIELWIGFRDEDRESLDRLARLPVFSNSGATLPLAAVARLETTPGPGEIHRADGRTVLTVTARFLGDDIREAHRAVDRALAEVPLPAGARIEEGGAFEDFAQAVGDLGAAGVLAMVFVFLAMGVLFESVALPIVVTASVPFAIAGAVWGLALTGLPMDVMAMVGMVVLVGVVVNNGIVLADRVHRLRGTLADRAAEVRAAVRHRMRPILMTALTTICGLVPMALEGGGGAGGPSYQTLAVAVMAGLAVSTALTLVAVPVAYTLVDDLRVAAAGWWRAALGGRGRL